MTTPTTLDRPYYTVLSYCMINGCYVTLQQAASYSAYLNPQWKIIYTGYIKIS